jgi:multicomponent Na+:H+ antiporter subunit E
MRSLIPRAVGFITLWLILSGADPNGFAAGAVAVVAATWTSLVLLPAGRMRASPTAIGRLVLRFLHQSIVAGTDVAWRALDPRLPLRPGFVTYSTRLAPGTLRNTFCTVSSLLPGTLPMGADASGALLIHCLDTREPVLEQLAEEEAMLTQALEDRRYDG